MAMKRFVNFVPTILSNKILKLSEIEIASDYCSVAIRFPAEGTCEAMQKFETKPYLSIIPPAFLETKQRFLWNEAPQLPLPGCTLERCRCRYVHYRDRREQDRRHRYDDPQAPFDPGYVGLDRRAKSDRRRPPLGGLAQGPVK